MLDGEELVGYAASVLVVLSLAMTSVVRLRVISLAGSLTFVAYGVLIESIPIVVTNASIAALNVWFLSRELGGRRDLGATVVPPDSPFLADFITHHASDIRNFQPEWASTDDVDFALVVNRDGLPAGVVLGRRHDGRLDITLDYVLRAYRDSRVGRWLYGDGAQVFRSAGITSVSTPGGAETHRSYLRRVGFEYDDGSQRFVKQL